jgi:hydrogenase maturation factor
MLSGDLALVDTGGSVEEVSVALVDAAVGATILVHAKEAIAGRPARTAQARGALAADRLR